MRALIVSDVHGDSGALERVLEKEYCQDIFCLGDGIRQYEDAREFHPDVHFHIVKGNCDWDNFYPAVNLEEWGGKRVEYMHGHLQDVKRTLTVAVSMGLRDRADILLFGHTHEPYLNQEKEMLVCNPGSLARGDYAVMMQEGADCQITLKSLFDK